MCGIDDARRDELIQLANAVMCGDCVMQGSRAFSCEKCTEAQQRALVDRIMALEQEVEMRAELDAIPDEEVETTLNKIRRVMDKKDRKPSKPDKPSSASPSG